MQMITTFIPFLVALIGGLVLTRSIRLGAGTRTAEGEKGSARRWAGTCLGLLACGPMAHGAYAFMRGEPLPMDAIVAGWFSIPLSWFLYDWDRFWEHAVTESARQGYSTFGAALLLKFVTAGVVFMDYWLLVMSLGGAHPLPRFPLQAQ